MWIKQLLLALAGVSFGLLAASGVFTVLASVGLTPRFAGKSHEAKQILLFENMIALGTIVGGITGVWFEQLIEVVNKVRGGSEMGNGLLIITIPILVSIGIFSGMFVGCLALSIAEMLDSIPIFARRIHFRKGVGFAVVAVAAGKFVGSFLYFMLGIYQNGG